MTDVAAVIAADKATTEAATKAPWKSEPDSAAGRVWVQLDRGGDLEPLFNVRSKRDNWNREEMTEVYAQRERDAALVVAARNRWPVYIAAIEAVIRLCDADAVTMYPYADDDFPGDKVVLVEDLRRALAVLAVPSTPNKEQQ